MPLRDDLRAWMPLSAVLLGACVMGNPAFDEREGNDTGAAASRTDSGTTQGGSSDVTGIGGGSTGVGGDATGTTAANTTAADDTAGTDSTGVAGVDACQPSPPAGACSDTDARCSECVDGTCAIACVGDDACVGTTITCPAGVPCQVMCIGQRSCRDAVIQCGPDQACAVQCVGKQACERATVQAGNGTSTIDCQASASACRELTVACGPADTVVDCSEPQVLGPFTASGDTCRCEALPTCD